MLKLALPFHAAYHIDAVGALFKGAKQVDHVHLPGAGHNDDSDVRRVLEPHGTCQVRGRVPSELAAEGDDDRIEILHQMTPSSKASTLLMT